MPEVLLYFLSHETFWGFLRICLFFKTVPMYFSFCQKLFIYLQIISESLGMRADTALSFSWVVWLQQFQSWKKSKSSMVHDVKCKGRISSYFWLLAVFQNSPGILGLQQVYSVDVEMSRQYPHPSVPVLDCQLYYECQIKILPLTSEIRV